MRLSARRVVAFLTLAAGGGYLLAGPGTGCSSYLGESAFVAIDFCFIFDCQSGFLGGTIDPCASSGDGPGQGPLFVDCP
jgi:hypothetical protein